MVKDPFSSSNTATRHLLEQEQLAKTYGVGNYASEIARVAAGVSALPGDYGSTIAAHAAGLGTLSQSLRDTALGLTYSDKAIMAEIAASSRSMLDRVAALTLPAYSPGLNLTYEPLRIAQTVAGIGVDDTTFRSIAVLGDRFRRPELDEISRIGGNLQAYINDTYGLNNSSLLESLTAIKQPWLDIHDTAASIMGFAKLQGIGHLVVSVPSFDIGVATTLRSDFGDWRDPITWPTNLGTDVGVRAALYLDRGFNSALTEFPVEAFGEGLEASGLHDNTPVLVAAYGDPVPLSNDPEQESSFARNNLVHDWLQRFETQIRKFIDDSMTAIFGKDWPRHKLPNGLYDKWLDKQRKDISGRAWPLIHYADFTDYELVICREDNWKSVFRGHFPRPELVRESLQRLYPSRLATMHARMLMPEDELFVFAEITRLIKQFKV
ncbi:hypothetical protein ACFWXH_04760 [Mesorhizobium sp. NPDC059054]|uniref:hypothetical protein n=1 Tax=Mesorhizobium sp. NPDC059054 TaxID=3346711 RepID=UPI0036BEC595